MAQRVTLEAGSIYLSAGDLTALRAGRMPEQMFFRAVLARRERNRNADEFTAAHLQEIADSIAHTPVDDEHHQGVVLGTILSATYEPDRPHPRGGLPGALVAEVVTWPRRFPELALALVAGTKKLSIESGGDEVECSSCRARFPTTATEADYCACLQARRANGTSRLWHKNRGQGAAFTSTPAGTDCEVERESLMLVASLSEDPWESNEESRMDPEKITALLEAAYKAASAGEETVAAAKTEGEIALVKSVLGWARGVIKTHADAARTAQDAALATQKTELETAHEAALTAKEKDAEARVTTERRLAQLAQLPLAVANPEDRRALVASLDEPTWAVLHADYKDTQAKLAARPAAEAPATDPLLTNSARQTAPVPGTQETAAHGATTDPAPKSLRELQFVTGA